VEALSPLEQSVMPTASAMKAEAAMSTSGAAGTHEKHSYADASKTGATERNALSIMVTVVRFSRPR
jgi:hypothetical protein